MNTILKSKVRLPFHGHSIRSLFFLLYFVILSLIATVFFSLQTLFILEQAVMLNNPSLNLINLLAVSFLGLQLIYSRKPAGFALSWAHYMFLWQQFLFQVVILISVGKISIPFWSLVWVGGSLCPSLVRFSHRQCPEVSPQNRNFFLRWYSVLYVYPPAVSFLGD